MWYNRQGCHNDFVLLYTGPGEYVVKAQILAGGRGLGVFDSGFKGGVHLTKEYAEQTDKEIFKQ